jgi:hypothetical protein
MTRARAGLDLRSAVTLLVTVLLLTGCLSPREDPTRFYVLSAADPSQGDEGLADRPGPVDIGVGPFTIPGYLDRPQFVRRLGPNEVSPVEDARWAETLNEGFERVLAENLDLLLPMARVQNHPWRSSTRAEWIISGNVSRFETDASGEAVLDVTWRVFGPDRQPTSVGARSVIRADGSGASVDADVAAMSEVIGRFAVIIADSLRTLEPSAQHDH